jgi:hypothetical protein
MYVIPYQYSYMHRPIFEQNKVRIDLYKAARKRDTGKLLFVSAPVYIIKTSVFTIYTCLLILLIAKMEHFACTVKRY